MDSEPARDTTLHTTNCILNLVVGRVRYRYLVPIGSPIFFFLHVSLRQRMDPQDLAAAVGPLVIPVPVVRCRHAGWPPSQLLAARACPWIKYYDNIIHNII